jgi:DNA-binding CsgD family transcriptional regulator
VSVGCAFYRSDLPHHGPQFARALEMIPRLGAQLTDPALQGLLDRISGAAFLVGPQRKVTAANRRAFALLEQNRLLRISLAFELTFTGHREDEAFRHALQHVFVLSRASHPTSFMVENEGRRCPVLVLSFRNSNPLAVPHREPGVALVLISGAHKVPSPPSEVLKSLYELSHAEASVVLSISGGDTLQTTADRLGICRVTARNQLAAAMAKIGVHRQGALVGVVTSLSPYLDFGPDE